MSSTVKFLYFQVNLLDLTATATAKSLQLCPTVCDPIDSSPPGSPIPGILQARTLEWVAISFSSAWKWKVKVKTLSRVRLLATPWTAAHQAPASMGFSRQEYWSGVPLPSLWKINTGWKKGDFWIKNSVNGWWVTYGIVHFHKIRTHLSKNILYSTHDSVQNSLYTKRSVQ